VVGPAGQRVDPARVATLEDGVEFAARVLITTVEEKTLCAFEAKRHAVLERDVAVRSVAYASADVRARGGTTSWSRYSLCLWLRRGRARASEDFDSYDDGNSHRRQTTEQRAHGDIL
jgi:hypothetical protein